MMGFSFASIFVSLIFSGIGTVAFVYGKRRDEPLLMVQGAVLTVYPYFVPDALWMFLVGVALTYWIWYSRN